VGVVVVFQLVAEDVSVLLEIDSLKLDPVDEGVSPNSVPHKASSASCFCGLSSVSKRLYLTVSTRELRTDRRRAVAVGGGQPPTRQRRHSPAGLLGRWLAVESVVRWPICGDGPTHREGRPRSSSNHIDELLVRPPPGATPASAGVATYRSEGTARRSVRGDSPPRTAAVPLIRVSRCRYRFAQTSDSLTRYRVSSSGIERPVVSR